jgi:hypothetical protein
MGSHIVIDWSLMYSFSWWYLAVICVVNRMKCIHTYLHFRWCMHQFADSCIPCNLSGEMLAISYSQIEIPDCGTSPVKSKLQGRIVHSRQYDDMLLCKMKHPLKNIFKVTHYVSIKYNLLFLFKYSYMWSSVKWEMEHRRGFDGWLLRCDGKCHCVVYVV